MINAPSCTDCYVWDMQMPAHAVEQCKALIKRSYNLKECLKTADDGHPLCSTYCFKVHQCDRFVSIGDRLECAGSTDEEVEWAEKGSGWGFSECSRKCISTKGCTHFTIGKDSEEGYCAQEKTCKTWYGAQKSKGGLRGGYTSGRTFDVGEDAGDDWLYQSYAVSK